MSENNNNNNNNPNIGVTEIETNSATGEKKIDNNNEIETITIPKIQYESLINSNKNGLMIVFDLVDRFDEVLNRLADFESFVRQQKIIAKNLVKSATAPLQQSTQQQQQSQQQEGQ